MSPTRGFPALLALLALLASWGPLAQCAGATGLSDDGGAEWRVEQPEPPPPPPGVERSSIPIGLGKIGDIEFWAPNRGALITAGNGSTITPGVWLYNGVGWRELATVCGATDGRIAWAGPEEFWTISDGRTGQAAEARGQRPPLEDNTLCHFAPGASGKLEVVASYGEPAFQSNSYQAMHAAACFGPTDCWFAGDPLPEPQIGAFQLHWNGHTVAAEPYLPEGHAVRDMIPFEGRLYQSVQLLTSDRVIKHLMPPPALRLINPEGDSPTFEAVQEPAEQELLYAPKEFPSALEYLHLGADENALWAAAGPSAGASEGSKVGVTVLRYSKLRYAGQSGEPIEEATPAWSQVLGPKTSPTGFERFFTAAPNAKGELEQVGDGVSSIAAEPGTGSAWLALSAFGSSGETGHALVAHISADGAISDELQLPAGGEPSGYGPKGAAEKIVCPAVHDCWMASTQGWLLHLATATERTLAPDTAAAFALEEPIAFRPSDESVTQVPPDAPPLDDSGLEETPPLQESAGVAKVTENKFATVAVPLLSHVRSRLVHRTTLDLSFHLAVRARVRLLAKHHRSVVASTPMRTLEAGNHSLMLRLEIRRWPTKLELQTHALAPLPTRSTREAGTNTVSTSLAFPNAVGPLGLELPR
jgi:hypothetical protein